MSERSEQAIFDDLSSLCASRGYIHALAYLCFRDNMVRYSGEMKPVDMAHMFSTDRLIRTEIATLIGLMIKTEIDYRVPPIGVVKEYIERTDALLKEAHRAMSEPIRAAFDHQRGVGAGSESLLSGGHVLREAIFYGGESAYSFQYRELALRRYSRDDDWLMRNKRFTMESARRIVLAIGQLLDQKAMATAREMPDKPIEEWTYLPGNTFGSAEVSAVANVDISTVESFLGAFALPMAERNSEFRAIHDFNVANALPLIPLQDGRYVLFHIYNLAQALYESPIYWMRSDSAYGGRALQNRGLFTEEFSIECLERVFGKGGVFPNVEISEGKGKTIAEIDGLVIFGNRAIVLQAKSKGLTLEARQGNDGRLREDFKKSVQDSCDQAYTCATALSDPKYTLKDARGSEISIPASLKIVYVLCVVADHYPALAFQSREFLKFHATDATSPPFVLDVFTLDAMTEFLRSPLQFLSYVDRRTMYRNKLVASHELTILSFHLKQNLWLGDEYDLVVLEDDISVDLDLAMLARREGIPAKRTPEGILTRFSETTLGQWIRAIDNRPDPGTIDFGFMLLTLSENTVQEIGTGINTLVNRSKADGRSHDLTIGLGKGHTGLTIHCNNHAVDIAGQALKNHCYARKYTERAETWFGVCIDPKGKGIRFGLSLDFAWQRDDQMDALTENMAAAVASAPSVTARVKKARNVGRNDLCPCGSGRKYKKCCLRR